MALLERGSYSSNAVYSAFLAMCLFIECFHLLYPLRVFLACIRSCWEEALLHCYLPGLLWPFFLTFVLILSEQALVKVLVCAEILCTRTPDKLLLTLRW